jgi:RNA polymerase sigma-70 factor (ECF subfamily)
VFINRMDTVTVGANGAMDTGGDAALFEQLYPSLRRFAAVTGGPDDEPDDLVQEAVARTLRRRSLQSIENPGAYLRTAIVHLVVNGRRKQARWRTAASRLHADSEGRDPEYTSDLADLFQLHPASRALLFLVEVEGRSYAEAAALLDTTEEAARTRAARARRQLRLQLIEESE